MSFQRFKVYVNVLNSAYYIAFVSYLNLEKHFTTVFISLKCI